MPRFKISSRDYARSGATSRKVLSKAKFDSFGPAILGLGDINEPAQSIDAVAAVFDLEGFTIFSRQIEPHLAVPSFLSKFLKWLFAQIKTEMLQKEYPEGNLLYCPLPFFVKFMGDGLLVLWDVGSASDVARRNILVSGSSICGAYHSEFLPGIRGEVVDPPPRLRCGLARGTVFSVGNGEDYVGSCINMASRIQKIGGLTYAFNRRGFNLEGAGVGDFFTKSILIKVFPVRGIGDNELLGIKKSEFDKLSMSDRQVFRDPAGARTVK